jgi:hypothetical protein
MRLQSIIKIKLSLTSNNVMKICPAFESECPAIGPVVPDQFSYYKDDFWFISKDKENSINLLKHTNDEGEGIWNRTQISYSFD